MLSDSEEDPPSENEESMSLFDVLEVKRRQEIFLNLQLITHTYNDNEYLQQLQSCMRTDKEDLKRVVHGVLLSEATEGGMEVKMLKTKIKEIKGFKENKNVDEYVKKSFDFETLRDLLKRANDVAIINENGTTVSPFLDHTNQDLYDDALASVKNKDDKDRKKDERLARTLEDPANIEEFYRGVNRVIAAIRQAFNKHGDKDNALNDISTRDGSGETVLGIDYNHVATEYHVIHGVRLADDCKKICGRSTLKKGLAQGSPACLVDSIAMDNTCGDSKAMFIALKRGRKEYTDDDIRRAKEECMQQNTHKEKKAKKWEEADARFAQRAQQEQTAQQNAQARQDKQAERQRRLEEQMREMNSAAPPPSTPAAAPPPPSAPAPAQFVDGDAPVYPSKPPTPQGSPNRTGDSGELQDITTGVIVPPSANRAAPAESNDEEAMSDAEDESDEVASDVEGFSDDGAELQKDNVKINEALKKKKQKKKERKSSRSDADTSARVAAPPPRATMPVPSAPSASCRPEEDTVEETVPYGQLPPAPYILQYDNTQNDLLDEDIADTFERAKQTPSATAVVATVGAQQRRNQWDDDETPTVIEQPRRPSPQQQQQQQYPPAAPQPPVAQQEPPAPKTNSVFAPRPIRSEAYQQQQQEVQQVQQQQPSHFPMQQSYPPQAAAPYDMQQQQQYPPTSPPPPVGDVMHAPMSQQQQQPLCSPVIPAHAQQYQHYAGQNGSPSATLYDQQHGALVSNSHYAQAPFYAHGSSTAQMLPQQPLGGVPYGGAGAAPLAQPPYSSNAQYPPQQQLQYAQQYPPQGVPPLPAQHSGPGGVSPVNLHVNVHTGPPLPPGPEYQQPHPQSGYHHGNPPNPAVQQQPPYQGGHPQDAGRYPSPAHPGYAAPAHPHAPPAGGAPYYAAAGVPPPQPSPHHSQQDYGNRRPLDSPHDPYGYGNGGAPPPPRDAVRYRDDPYYYNQQQQPPPRDDRAYYDDRRGGGSSSRGGSEYAPQDYHHQQQQYREDPRDRRYQEDRRGDYQEYDQQARRYPPTQDRRAPRDDYDDQRRESPYAEPVPRPRSRNSPPVIDDFPPSRGLYPPNYHHPQQAPPPPMTSSSTMRSSGYEEPRGFGRPDSGSNGRGFGRADEVAVRRPGGGYEEQHRDRGGSGGGGFGRPDPPPNPTRQQQQLSGGYGGHPPPPQDDGRGGLGREYSYKYEENPARQQHDRPQMVLDRPVDASTPLNRSRDENPWHFFDQMKSPKQRIRWQVISILKCVRDKNSRKLREGRANEFELIEITKMEELVQRGCGNDMEAYEAIMMVYPDAQKPFYQFFRDMERDGLLRIYMGTVRNSKLNSYEEALYVMDPFTTPPEHYQLKRRDQQQ